MRIFHINIKEYIFENACMQSIDFHFEREFWIQKLKIQSKLSSYYKWINRYILGNNYGNYSKVRTISKNNYKHTAQACEIFLNNS